ncbi:MAG: hypothetical protein ACSHYF_17495 [Verrucomicrobiaceae bacterium]
MNSLTQDLLLDAASRRRRHRLAINSASIALPLLLGCLFLFQKTTPGPLATTPPAPAPEPPAPLYQPLTSDAELLALLHDQSPALVTRPDGTRMLILTNPH